MAAVASLDSLLAVRYMCKVCKSVLRNPMQFTCCGSRVCKGCGIEKIFQRSSKSCGYCNIPLTFENFREDKAAAIEEVKCPYSLCDWKNSFKYLPDHLCSCIHRHVPCGECKSHFTFEDVELHRVICFKLHTYNGTRFVPEISGGVQETCKNTTGDDVVSKLCGLAARSEFTAPLKAVLKAKFPEPILLEVFSTNGILKWKVDNFKKAEIDARNRMNALFYSPIFYLGSCERGYKMRLRLAVNGFQEGSNSHMSLSLIILKGPSDDILPWPLKTKVKFMLMNPAQGETFSELFTPDPFLKPTSLSEFEGAEAGYNQFIDLDFVPSYIKDDAIFIKCIVELLN